MKPRLRVVTRMPMEEVWNDNGPLSATKVRDLGRDQIAELLRRGRVRFVVANVGDPLRWVSLADCYTFWKNDVKSNIADHDSFHLDDFPGGYAFVASEWRVTGGDDFVLLEMHH